VAPGLPRNDRSRSGAERASTTPSLETAVPVAAEGAAAESDQMVPTVEAVDERPDADQLLPSGPVAEQSVDEPWDEAWLPGWVNDADAVSVTDEPLDDELTGDELTDAARPDENHPEELFPEEALEDEVPISAAAVPAPLGSSTAEPGSGQDTGEEAASLPEPAVVDEPVGETESADETGLRTAGQDADPVPAAAAPVRRVLPPRIDAALAELREAELAAQRAAEEQAAVQMAAWEEAIRAGEELAERAVSSSRASDEPSATPSSPLHAVDDVPDVRTAPTESRRRTRVLLPLAVLLVAGLLAGFSFTTTSSGDGAEVAASERDADVSTSSPFPARIPAPRTATGQAVDPLAGVPPVLPVAEPPTETTASTTSRVRARATAAAGATSPADAPARGTPTVDGPSTAPVPGPVTGATPTGSGPTGGTGTEGTGGTGSDGAGTGGTPTDGTSPEDTPTDGTPTDGTGDPGDATGEPVECPTDDGTGETGADPVDEAGGEVAGACEEDPDSSGPQDGPEDGQTALPADQTPTTVLGGRKG
jgi:hypothetical protein